MLISARVFIVHIPMILSYFRCQSRFCNMRLTCDTEIGNRLLPSFNMKSKNKTRTQMSVGCKPGNTDLDIYLMICTSKDRSGQKYKLHNNVEKLFNKFIDDGKATIRLANPQHDIIVSKADPIQLKSFLSVVRLGHLGKNIDKSSLSTLAPASAKQVEKPKTKLVILAKKDYPVLKGFPKELEILRASQCKLKKIDLRILELKKLRSLDLSYNCIQSLPEVGGKLQNLAELIISDNQLTTLPVHLFTSSLQTSLKVLDLSRNNLKLLPPEFCKLLSLYSLKLDKNGLMCLPHNFGNLSMLRVFTATENNLCCLPGNFSKLTLDMLDLFGNTFMEDGPSSVVSRLQDITLVECAAKSIKKHRVPYTEEDVPFNLYEMMKNAKQCLCGQYCFHSFAHYLVRLDLHRIAHTVVNIDHSGRTHAPAESFLCSQHCLNKYQTNPYAFWKKS